MSIEVRMEQTDALMQRCCLSPLYSGGISEHCADVTEWDHVKQKPIANRMYLSPPPPSLQLDS